MLCCGSYHQFSTLIVIVLSCRQLVLVGPGRNSDLAGEGEWREKSFLRGITLGGTKCLLIPDSLDTEGNNIMDLHTKGQSWGSSQAVTAIQMESVYLVSMGQKGAEGELLNPNAFEMAGYVGEAIHERTAHL